MTPRPRRAVAVLFMPVGGLEFNGQPGALHSAVVGLKGAVTGQLVDRYLPIVWPPGEATVHTYRSHDTSHSSYIAL